ncbi:MAG: hypothetical protein KME16_28075 [Scytolyngbya sp. HA4215-MV1]|nr:hypothetical protein [Scytolyngbya sp. HA4215-MV1]
MPYSNHPPRRRKQRRPVRPLRPDRVATEFERIKQRLGQEGYKLRRSPNNIHLWRVTGRFEGFYLLSWYASSGWNVQPNDWSQERDTLLQLIKEALSESSNLEHHP